ncbi:3 beta-hydroxysteroid dehydrogenase/Delta 5--_4-isomerase [Planctomycetes bacterium Poly30]|uniref:3 beta-hydroxysteroid dehydrogenase/Delta 5-->4-isomerase n=1 Tax=Saltatorellus ferox TaxID=2528018 RepID=A0A518EPD8_9BACT|nr:3 beta-hydroxysteroid dehydrogenase/Delta 5-->4-isomerase [Planctomycetes bacterium Poly30]
MNGRRLLITGCDGFIGQHVAREARAQGWTTIGVSRAATPLAEVDERIELNLLAPDAEDRLVRAMGGAEAVVHAAARVQLFGRAAPVIADNVASTRSVLGAAARAGAPRVVFLSSACVLFEPFDQPGLREDAALPARCMNGYAESKKRCEGLVAEYPGSWAILRPQAVIGPGDRTLLPPVLAAARSGRWRWIGRRDAASTDLLSVGNLVEYSVRAAGLPEATGVFHLSDGEVVPIETLFRQVFEALSIRVAEKRVSSRSARALALAVETPMRWLAPAIAPPLTAFGVEVLTRTRTLDRTRTLRYLGPPSRTLREGLDRALETFASG